MSLTPVSSPVLLDELRSARAVLDKWVQKVEQGIPGEDVPVQGNTDPGDRLDLWITELVGEMRLVSGKTENLAQIFASLLLD